MGSRVGVPVALPEQRNLRRQCVLLPSPSPLSMHSTAALHANHGERHCCKPF